RVVRRLRGGPADRGRPDRAGGRIPHRQRGGAGRGTPAPDRQAARRGAEGPLRGGRGTRDGVRGHHGRPRLPGPRRGPHGGGDGAGGHHRLTPGGRQRESPRRTPGGRERESPRRTPGGRERESPRRTPATPRGGVGPEPESPVRPSARPPVR